MKYKLILLFWCFFSSPFLSALGEAGEGFTELHARFEDNLSLADAAADLEFLQIGRAYEQALERLFDAARAEGDLDFVTEVREEQERFSSHRVPPESLSTFSGLQRLQQRLREEYERIQRGRARLVLQYAAEYDGELEALQRSQVMQGEIDMAMRTREERQAVTDREPVRRARNLLAESSPEDASEAVRTEPAVPRGPPPEATPFFGRHYLLVREDLTWQQARERAEAMGGRLVTIPNRRVNDFLREQILVRDRHFFWAGATNENPEEVWQWISGAAFRYTNWAPGEPNNWNGREHHLAIRRDGLWNDMNEEHPTWFICEWGP